MPHFYLEKAGSAIELRLVRLLPVGTELHCMGSLNSPFVLASKHYFCTGVKATAVLLYSELVFAFQFAHIVANVTLGLACLGNGCNVGAKM